MISSKELEVKQIGTTRNVSDIGTQLLSQQSLKFLLRKCHAIDGDGNGVGEKERQGVEEREMQRGNVQRLATAPEKIMFASGLGSVAQAERTEVTLQKESLSRTWFWVILCATAVVLFGVFLIRKPYKKLEKRMEENEPALRFQVLGLKSAKEETEEARLEFKSYVVNQGPFSRERLRRVLRKKTSSHLHLCTSTFTRISLLIFTSAHLHLCSSSHLRIISAHLHILTSSLFIPAHLHILTSSLLIFTSSHLQLTSSPLALLNFLS